MDASDPQGRLRTAALVGLAYVVVGLTTAALSRSAPSPQIRTVWRLAAWAISALIFGAHIAYERRLRVSAANAALHTAMAVALATFVLAASAVVHQFTSSGSLRGSMILAFAVWPILTGIPAFLVAFSVGALLRLMSGRAPQSTP